MMQISIHVTFLKSWDLVTFTSNTSAKEKYSQLQYYALLCIELQYFFVQYPTPIPTIKKTFIDTLLQVILHGTNQNTFIDTLLWVIAHGTNKNTFIDTLLWVIAHGTQKCLGFRPPLNCFIAMTLVTLKRNLSVSNLHQRFIRIIGSDLLNQKKTICIPYFKYFFQILLPDQLFSYHMGLTSRSYMYFSYVCDYITLHLMYVTTCDSLMYLARY